MSQNGEGLGPRNSRSPFSGPSPDATADSLSPHVRLNGVQLSFGATPILAGIDLEIPPGEFLGILGPSGSGKSTLLRLVAGLTKATSGEVTVALGPEPTNGNQPERVETSFVFQDPTLLPWRTVNANVRLPLDLRRLPQRDQTHRIRDVLKLVGLTEADGRKFPRQLSGGMRMRASLARALITSPRLLLLDEPFAALDELLRQQLNEEVAALWFERRFTGLFVTHNVSEAAFMCQRLVILGGKPARLAATIDVPFPFPRTDVLRATPEFAAFVAKAGHTLREAMS